MNNIDVSWKNHSIEELNVPLYTIRFLKKIGIANLYELFHKTEEQFMQMRTVSEHGLTRVLGRKELHLILEAIDECKKSLLSDK